MWQVLQQLYDADVISEQAFMAWADEKQHADESDCLYLTRCVLDHMQCVLFTCRVVASVGPSQRFGLLVSRV